MNKSLTKLLILIIIVAFISSYMIASSGYYEWTMQQRTVITNEKIKEFEQDIKDNKDIDMKDYFEEEEIDYSNTFTTLVYNLSDNSNKLARKLMKSLFKRLSYLVED